MDFDKCKEFITWCRSNKVKSFTSTEFSFELSEISFIEEVPEMQNPKESAYLKTKEDEDEDLLFWSSKP